MLLVLRSDKNTVMTLYLKKSQLGVIIVFIFLNFITGNF